MQRNGVHNCWRLLQSCSIVVFLACQFTIQSLGQQPTRTPVQSGGTSSSIDRQIAESLKAGRVEEAERIARAAVASNPRDAQAHTLLGVVLDQRGQTDEAEKELREAVRLNPKSAGALTNLAVLLGRTKRLEEALTTFQRVLRLDPDHLQANYNLALLHISRKEYQPAIPPLQRLVKLSGGDDTAELEVLLALADAYAHTERYEDAMRVADVAERRAGDEPRILFTLALALADAWDPLESTCRHASLSIL